jgi:hypothetical protein
MERTPGRSARRSTYARSSAIPPISLAFSNVTMGIWRRTDPRYPNISTYVVPPPEGPDLYDCNTIAYLPERLELLDRGGFYLSETPEVWSLGWDATYVKALTWARFRHREDQLEFLSLNTHLEHIGERARVESVHLILSRLPELHAKNSPVIFTGDVTFLDAGGEDSAATFTFHGFEGARYWAANHHMAGCIDWILTLASASSVQANECSIVRDAEPPSIRATIIQSWPTLFSAFDGIDVMRSSVWSRGCSWRCWRGTLRCRASQPAARSAPASPRCPADPPAPRTCAASRPPSAEYPHPATAPRGGCRNA